MVNQTVSLEQTIAFLNGLVDADEAAILALIGQRVPCNEAMLNHPTVQAGVDEGVANVGFLGVLNGLFGTIDGGPFDGWGPIKLTYGPNERARFSLTS